ncbi:MAG: protein-disulfide reductase DsbD domain-containing protein [Candidatus Azotimanducaceae bacterium]
MKYVSLVLGILFVTMAFATDVSKKKEVRVLSESKTFFNNNAQVILPPDLAFGFDHEFFEEFLVLSWNIQPGYFLYRNKVAVLCGDNEINLNLPIGKPWQDEVFGEVSILEGEIEARVDTIRKRSDCRISYQGCSSAGYCYPPVRLPL